jgi:hypothetical protein
MEIVVLNKEQASKIHGKEYTTGMLFNCVQLDENTFYISKEVQERCEIEWIKQLPLTEFEPINNEANE